MTQGAEYPIPNRQCYPEILVAMMFRDRMMNLVLRRRDEDPLNRFPEANLDVGSVEDWQGTR